MISEISCARRGRKVTLPKWRAVWRTSFAREFHQIALKKNGRWWKKLWKIAARFLGFRIYSIVPIPSTAETIGVLEAAGPLISGRVVNSRVEEALDSPNRHQLTAHVVNDALLSLNRRGGFALREGELLTRSPVIDSIPKIVFGGAPVAGELNQIDSSVLLRKPVIGSTVPEGIYVGALAPHNWFHWLIDTLPVVNQLAKLPRALGHAPVLLPSTALVRDTWITALDCVLHGRKVLPLDPASFHKIRKLVLVDGATTAFPRPLGPTTAEGRIFANPLVLQQFKERVLESLEISPDAKKPFRKIFLARRATAARPYNQEEIFSVAKSFGFSLVFLEDLTFRQSVKIFTEAEAIVGPHGAGLANCLFSPARTPVLYWTWEDRRGDNWYETLFRACQLDVRVLRIPAQSHHGSAVEERQADYRLSVREFRQSLEEMLSLIPQQGRPSIK